MYAQAFQFPGHLKAFGLLHAAAEAVVHIHLHNYAYIVSGSLQDPADYPSHEAHTVFQGAAVFITPVICERGQELAYEIPVTGMDFNAVEAGLAGKVHGRSKVLYQGIYLRDGEGPAESG